MQFLHAISVFNFCIQFMHAIFVYNFSTTITGVQLYERLAFLGIIGVQLKAPLYPSIITAIWYRRVQKGLFNFLKGFFNWVPKLWRWKILQGWTVEKNDMRIWTADNIEVLLIIEVKLYQDFPTQWYVLCRPYTSRHLPPPKDFFQGFFFLQIFFKLIQFFLEQLHFSNIATVFF